MNAGHPTVQGVLTAGAAARMGVALTAPRRRLLSLPTWRRGSSTAPRVLPMVRGRLPGAATGCGRVERMMRTSVRHDDAAVLAIGATTPLAKDIAGRWASC